MAESSFTNFFNNSQAFGMNIVKTRTMQQVGETATNVAGGVFEPLFTYLEENENVFNGDITHELNKTLVASFNTKMILCEADELTNGPVPVFDTKF